MKVTLVTQINSESLEGNMTHIFKKLKKFLFQKYQCPWCENYCINAFSKMRLANPLNTRDCPICKKYIKIKVPWKSRLSSIIILILGLTFSFLFPFYRYSPIILAILIINVKDIFFIIPKLPILKD